MINHLLVSCVFTRQVWAGLFREVGLQELIPQQTEDAFEAWWHLSRQRVQGEVRRGFNSLVILGAWIIWKHRNQCVFRGSAPNVAAALLAAREEALLWTLVGARGLSFIQALGSPQ
jgi:hypothetical protein